MTTFSVNLGSILVLVKKENAIINCDTQIIFVQPNSYVGILDSKFFNMYVFLNEYKQFFKHRWEDKF